jgi:hypothetical protein
MEPRSFYIVDVYRSCGTFSDQERLPQQNGDIEKRNGVKTTCIPPLLLPPPPLTPPFKCDNKGSQPARNFCPPPSPPPPHRIMDKILAASPKVEDGLRSGDCEYDS